MHHTMDRICRIRVGRWRRWWKPLFREILALAAAAAVTLARSIGIIVVVLVVFPVVPFAAADCEAPIVSSIGVILILMKPIIVIVVVELGWWWRMVWWIFP